MGKPVFDQIENLTALDNRVTALEVSGVPSAGMIFGRSPLATDYSDNTDGEPLIIGKNIDVTGSGRDNIYIGTDLTIQSVNVLDSVYIGNDITPYLAARGVHIGGDQDNTVTAGGTLNGEATSVGYGAEAKDWRATAFGAFSKVNRVSGGAFGWGSEALNAHDLAIGRSATAISTNSTTIGGTTNAKVYFANGQFHLHNPHTNPAGTEGRSSAVLANNDPDHVDEMVHLIAKDAYDWRDGIGRDIGGGTNPAGADFNNGGHMAICGGRPNHPSNVGGNVYIKTAPLGSSSGNNVKGTWDTVAEFDTNTTAEKFSLILADGAGTRYRLIRMAGNVLGLEAL